MPDVSPVVQHHDRATSSRPKSRHVEDWAMKMPHIVSGWAQTAWPHYSCNHTFAPSIKKEVSVFESFWDRTEVGISFVEGVIKRGKFTFAFLCNRGFQLLIIVLSHKIQNRFHNIS